MHGQDFGSLHLSQDRLTGKCDNQYFTGFEIELDSSYALIDSTLLFSQLPRIGTINFKNRIDIPTEFTLTERAGYPQIMFKFRTSYYTFDHLRIDSQSISFTMDDDPVVPPTQDDLSIIQLAKKLLASEENWNHNDDRNCEDDLANNSYSLYCALRLATLEVENRYNHRNAALQKLRHLIASKFPDRKWNHRFMEFNNMKETKFEDIVGILDSIEKDFVEELNNR